MYPIRYLFLFFLTFLGLSGFSQSKDSCFLRWKLQPAETLSYKIVKHQVDTPTNRAPSFDDLFNSTDKPKDVKTAINGMNELMKGLSSIDQNMVAHLTKGKKGRIGIDIALDDTTANQTDSTMNAVANKDSLPNFSALFKHFSAKAITRGLISEDGQIQSFYTTANERNLIALFFQLPGHYVKIGDMWPLDTHFVSINGYFVCDSSFRNNVVTVTDIQRQNGDCLVYLSYNISEYASGYLSIPMVENSQMKTLMKIEYKGTACFSIDKGRWITFKGTMSSRHEMWSRAQSTETYSLVEKL